MKDQQAGADLSSKMPGTVIAMFAEKATSKLSKMPSEYARDNVYLGVTVTPSSMARREEICIDWMMWGANFSHHEGSSAYSRLALRGTMAGYPEDELRKLLAGNAATLYRADMDLLQVAADRVGSPVDEINEPLRSDEIPEDPNFGFIIETYLGMSNIVGPKRADK